MDQAQLLQLVQTVNEKYNEILANAKKINELLAQGTFEPNSLVAVWNPTTNRTEKQSLQAIIDEIINGNNALVNQLISIGEITIDGNDVTIPAGVNWIIGGNSYFTTEDAIFNVPFASTGQTRIDIIVANVLGELVLYNGTETDGIAIRPNIPLNTVLVTQINVTDTSFNAVDYGLNHNELAAIHGANSPSGSNVFATMDDLGGVSVSPFNAKAVFDESVITVPAGFTGIITNLNNTYSDVTFTVSGTGLTVTGGADAGDLLLINGQY